MLAITWSLDRGFTEEYRQTIYKTLFGGTPLLCSTTLYSESAEIDC